ncbi:Virginiamycin B lyase [compost metagenome]
MTASKHPLAPFALGLLLVTAGLGGCLATPTATVASAPALRGEVRFPVRQAQATLEEVADGASVTLFEAASGNALASTVTDASGTFVLSFAGLAPTPGGIYHLEALKGLAMGGDPNRPGARAARLRTLLVYDGGWKSLTNTTPNAGVALSAATTAIATVAGLKQAAGTPLDLSKLVGKVSGASFDQTGTGLSEAADFTPVLGLVTSALSLDQDPLVSIAYDAGAGRYSLIGGIPGVLGLSPAIGTPGGTVTVRGMHFDPRPGRLAFWFGPIPAATWSVATDQTSATVTIPAQAYSAEFTVQQPGGVRQTLSSFYQLRGTVGTLAGSTIAGWADGTGFGAQFHNPIAVVPDADGALVVVDHAGHRVRRMSRLGQVTTLAGVGYPVVQDATTSVAAVGLSASFNWPAGVVLNPDGSLLLADKKNHLLRKITRDGVVSLFGGTGATGSVDGALANAQFNWPTNLKYRGGDLYLVDQGNHKIRKIAPDGTVTTFVGTGNAGNTEGTGPGAELNSPHEMAFDSAGNMFVASFGAFNLRKVTPGGVTSSFVGNPTTQGYLEGTGAAARMAGVHSVVADPSDNALYFTDWGNHLVRKVTAGAVTSLVAGTVSAGAGVAGYADGPLAAAKFRNPAGLYRAPDGTIYVADEGNHCIRVITP